MRELKKASSTWVKQTINLAEFRWQEGYGAFSLSPSKRGLVWERIANQEAHHEKRRFGMNCSFYSKNPVWNLIQITLIEFMRPRLNWAGTPVGVHQIGERLSGGVGGCGRLDHRLQAASPSGSVTALRQLDL